jgi:hypothetical protein
MSAATRSTAVGIFNERSDADRAIDDLAKAGFRKNQIRVVTRDPRGKAVIKKKGDAETHARNGALAGTLAGAGIGGMVGLGVLAGVIPVIGPALGAGTLATILTSAAGGAAIAGIGGALIGRRLLTERTKYFGSQLHAGRVVVTVQADDGGNKARAILESHGGFNPVSVAIA